MALLKFLPRMEKTIINLCCQSSQVWEEGGGGGHGEVHSPSFFRSHLLYAAASLRLPKNILASLDILRLFRLEHVLSIGESICR